jgi:hypothetical protein
VLRPEERNESIASVETPRASEREVGEERDAFGLDEECFGAIASGKLDRAEDTQLESASLGCNW